MEPIVEVNNITFGYNQEPVLVDVNLEIKRGEYVALVGPNGSGKSTLLKLMLGFLRPHKGKVKLFGIPVPKFKAWTRIGYISQKVRGFNQRFPATVRELVGASLYQSMGLVKTITPDLERTIDDALGQVDMVRYKDRQLGNLSGGQQQRVFIARTLVTKPEIIFLDEPMAGLDAEAQEDFYALLQRLNRDLGITLVLISHDLHVVSRQAGKIVCFENKRVYTHKGEDIKQVCSGKREDRWIIREHDHRMVEEP